MRQGSMSNSQYLSKGIKGFLFVLPSISGIMIFSLIPFADVLRRSFCNPFTGRWNGFENYRMIFENYAFLLALKNMVKFLVVCVPMLCFLSLIISCWLENYSDIRNLLKIVFLIPIVLPVSAVVLLCNIWLDGNGFYQLVVLYIWKNLGYMVLLWCAALERIPEELYEVSALDGANKIQQFRYITLPNVSTAGFVIIVISIINSFKVFRESYMLSGDYPHESIYMTQNIFNNWFRDLAIDKISAGTMVILIIVGFFVLILEKYWQKSGNTI